MISALPVDFFRAVIGIKDKCAMSDRSERYEEYDFQAVEA